MCNRDAVTKAVGVGEMMIESPSLLVFWEMMISDMHMHMYMHMYMCMYMCSALSQY